MANTRAPSLIGIDGGGTSCRFALLHHAQRFDVGRGAANATSDLGRTQATLLRGLQDLAAAAGLALRDMADFPTYIGVAGVMDAATAQALTRALPLTHVTVEDDRRAAVVGALGGGAGCVVAVGTGSFLARRKDGAEQMIGGWGLTLGDAASGAYLGQQVLRRVMEVHDGLLPPSPLTEQIFATFKSPADIVAFATTAHPGDLAAYAPQVVAAAADNDPVGLALMQDGARYIERGLTALGWQSGERICPIGGLAARYTPFLRAEIAADVAAPQGTALDGAISLASGMVPR